MPKETLTFEIEYQRDSGVYAILVSEDMFNQVQQIIIDGLKALDPDKDTAFSYKN